MKKFKDNIKFSFTPDFQLEILRFVLRDKATVLEGYSFVRRGYEHICQDLEQLGAAVKRIQE